MRLLRAAEAPRRLFRRLLRGAVQRSARVRAFLCARQPPESAAQAQFWTCCCTDPGAPAWSGAWDDDYEHLYRPDQRGRYALLLRRFMHHSDHARALLLFALRP